MLGNTKYKFRLARVPHDTRELAMSFESTWDVIQRSIATGFSDRMSGSLRHLTVVKTSTGQELGERVTDAGTYWLAMVKWYDAATTVFVIYDNSSVEIDLQLVEELSPSVTIKTPYMGPYFELVEAICREYPYLNESLIDGLRCRYASELDSVMNTSEQFWRLYTELSPTKRSFKCLIAAQKLQRVDVSSPSFPDKFPVFLPRDCSLDLLNSIVLDTAEKKKGSKLLLDSITVRSHRGNDDLTAVSQLVSLHGVSSSWLYALFRPYSLSLGSVKEVADRPSSQGITAETMRPYTIRFCLSGARDSVGTCLVTQGMTWDELKASVASECEHVTSADIKHFVLLDKDGDDFSSGLDNLTKFWRTTFKYFKDESDKSFSFNVVLNRRLSAAENPRVRTSSSIKPAPGPSITTTGLAGSPSRKNLSHEAIPGIPSDAVIDVAQVLKSPPRNKQEFGVDEISRTLSGSSKSTRSPYSGKKKIVLALSTDSMEEFNDLRVVDTSISNGASPAPSAGPSPQPVASSRLPRPSNEATSSVSYNMIVKLSDKAKKSVIPSRRLELIRRKEQRSSQTVSDESTVTVSFGCSWASILDAICKSTGLESAEEISFLKPIINNPLEPYQKITGIKDEAMVVDRYQFWGAAKRANDCGGSVVWEVHARSSQTQRPVGKDLGKECPSGEKEEPGKDSSVVVSVALYNHQRLVKPVLIPFMSSWEDLTTAVCDVLNIDTRRQILTHFIVFDKDGDQLSTEISTAQKFWKISSFSSAVLRVFVSDTDSKGQTAGMDVVKLADESSGGPLPRQALPGRDTSRVNVSTAPESSASGQQQESPGSELLSVTIAHARYPKKEISTVLKVNAAWAAISSSFLKALSLGSDLEIAYIIVFDRENRKFGSPIASCDKFWKNISYYSHHVLRVFTVAVQRPQSITEGSLTYSVVLADDLKKEKKLHYRAAPTMEDIRKAVSGAFRICADIITHVVFIDSDGDELSGALNTDAKLLKFFQHKDVIIKVFTSAPPQEILPRLRFPLELATDPLKKGSKVISLSRSPTWDEIRMEIAEELALPSIEVVDHIVFLDEDGDELSGNVNNDVKVNKFAAQAADGANITIKLFLNLVVDDKRDLFFSAILEDNIAELDKNFGSKFNIDKLNPENGMTAFLMCCREGAMESLRWLLQKQANIAQKTAEGGLNGLHLAIESNRNNVVDYLVALGISVFDTDSQHLTPFLKACSVANIHAAKLLLRRGAKTSDSQSGTGLQGIHLAVINNHIKMVQWLVEENNVSLESVDKFGMTPFLHACSCGFIDIAKWLQGKGANVHAVTNNLGEDAGSTALHIVCKNGHFEFVQFLLDLGLKSDACDNKGISVVEKAKLFQHFDIANYLLDKEMAQLGTLDIALLMRLLQLDEKSRARLYLEAFLKHFCFKFSEGDQGLLLHLAAACGHKLIVEYFTVLGCDLDVRIDNSEMTPLMHAAKFGETEIVKYLMSKGANTTLTDRTGCDAMRIAVLNGKAETAACLEDKLKEIKLKEQRRRKKDESRTELSKVETMPAPPPVTGFGMLFACISGMADAHPSASQLFVPPTLDEDIEYSDDEEYEDISTEHRALGESTSLVHTLIPQSGPPGDFPLHSICRRGGSEDLLRLLCSVISNIDVFDNEGYTALYIASALNHSDLVLCLVEHGADVSLFLRSAGETAMHSICQHNADETLRGILDRRPSLKSMSTINMNRIVDQSQNNLLHCAVLANAVEVVCTLLDDTEMDIDGADSLMRTPLHLGCINKFTNICFELLNRNADVYPKDSAGGTALLYAVMANEIDLVEALIDKGAKVTDRTATGNTVMHIACQIGNLEMAQYLYSRDASVLQRNEQGFTPYSYAVRCQHGHIMQWLASVDRKSTL